MSPTEDLDLFSAKPDQLNDLARESSDEARTIVETAASAKRDLTDVEQKAFNALMLRSTGLTTYAKDAARREGKSGPPDRGSPEVRSHFIGMGRELTDQIGLGGIPGGGYGPLGKAARGAGWGKAVLQECTDRNGARFKGITTSGTVLTPIPEPLAVQMGQPVSMVRSLIPTETDPAFAYLRQDVRDLRAAPTAPGAKKPESTLLYTRVDDKVSMIAHLIKNINRADLMHSDILQRLISSDLLYGLEAEIESQLLTGTGVGEDLLGLGATPGAQTATRAGDDGYSLIRVLRSAVTKLEVMGISGPGLGFVISAPDWEEVETAVLGDGSLAFVAGGNQSLPVDRSARTAWGIPVVSSAQCPPGTAFLADFAGSTRCWIPGPARIDWSEHIWDPNLEGPGIGGDLFSHNLVTFRAEIQIGYATPRPAGVVRIDLTPVTTP